MLLGVFQFLQCFSFLRVKDRRKCFVACCDGPEQRKSFVIQFLKILSVKKTGSDGVAQFLSSLQQAFSLEEKIRNVLDFIRLRIFTKRARHAEDGLQKTKLFVDFLGDLLLHSVSKLPCHGDDG